MTNYQKCYMNIYMCVHMNTLSENYFTCIFIRMCVYTYIYHIHIYTHKINYSGYKTVCMYETAMRNVMILL